MLVATVLTVYGIETIPLRIHLFVRLQLQQYLPFTVLKHLQSVYQKLYLHVATVLTVYGIETV